jgi:hypothetical protein
MTIDNTSNVRASAPLPPQAARPATPTETAPRTPTDSLKLAAAAKAADAALATIEAAKLPARGHFLLTHGQQDTWARTAAGEVAKAYAALQTLEAGQVDPLSAKPQAVIDQARAKVSQLAGDVAAHDPRNVRSAILNEGTRDLSLAVRRGAEITDPPLRGTMTKEEWAKAKDAWARGQHAEITAAREAMGQLRQRAELLHVEDYSAHMDYALDQAEKHIEEKLGPVQWGALIKGMIEVGGAVSNEIMREQQQQRH